MPDSTDWQKRASALRELHRALMERGRRDYDRAHNVVLSPVERLQLLTTDPFFDWLRGLSELMVDIDLVRDAKPLVLAEISPAVRAAVEYFIAAPNPLESGNAFAQHYWPYLQDDPQSGHGSGLPVEGQQFGNANDRVRGETGEDVFQLP